MDEYSEDSDELRAIEESKNFAPKWDLLAGDQKNRKSKDSKQSKNSKNSNKNSKKTNSTDDGFDKEALKKVVKKSKRRKMHSFEETRKNWVKVTHALVTKRMLNVPAHIDKLKIVLWNRFGTLKTRVSEPGKLLLQGEILSYNNGNKEKFLLTSSDDLASYVYLSNERGVCPRISIEEEKSQEPTIVKKKSPEYLALPVGGPKDERMSWGLHFSVYQDLSGIIKNGQPFLREVNLCVDDKEENKSIIDWGLSNNEPQNREENDYFGEGEDPLDQQSSRDVFQEQRDEEDKEIQLQDQEDFILNARPKIPQINIDRIDQELVVELSQSAKERRQEVRILKKRKKNQVNFNYDIKLARKSEGKDWGTQMTNIFKAKRGISTKDLAYVAHVPAQPSCPKNEYHTTVEPGQTAFIQFKVFNRTQNEWDPGCYLVNNYQDGYLENFFEITKAIPSNVMFFLEIQVYIPAIAYEQLLEITFQFHTPRLRPFGERMIAKIKVLQDPKLSIRSSLQNSLRENFVRESVSEEQMFQMAGELSDRGFGDFEVCLACLKEKKGDLASAQKSLSKVIFKKQKSDTKKKKH